MRAEGEAVLSISIPAQPAWDARQDAARAAAFVAGFVGVPAAIAAAAVLALFALAFVVLLAPLVAIGLTWIAWHYSRHPGAGRRSADARQRLAERKVEDPVAADRGP